MTNKLLMGNEAFAHAALEAGVRVVAGYPGTPSSELVETVAKLYAQGSAQGVHVEWSTNEKAALELVAGAAYCGARTLFTCKQVGLNVASDALMSLNYVGVKGGTVLFVADDPGPISSQTEQDTRRFASFAKVPVLDPVSPDQGFQMMQAAFELSERYSTPVIVRPTTRVCHASTFFDVAEETVARPVSEEGFQKDSKWVIFPKRSFEAHGEINERLQALAVDFSEDPAFAQFNPVFEGGCIGDEVVGSEAAGDERVGACAGVSVGDGVCEGVDREGNTSPVAPSAFHAPRIGIMAGGVSAAYAREALELIEARAAEVGAQVPGYRFMQVGTPYPFPERAAARFAEGLDAVLVFEELDSVLEDEMLRLAGKMQLSCKVRGRYTGDARDRGENSTEDIAARIAAVFDEFAAGDAGVVATSGNAVVATDGSVSDGLAANASDAGTAEPVEPNSSDFASAPLTGSASFFASFVREAVGEDALAGYDGPLPVRPPVLCAGCPHRGSFYAVKRALGKQPAVLCGDIGCYTLGNAKPLDAVDTCLCMGAGITMAQGFAVAEPHKKQVAFVGDSTFFASGLTGIVNAVYNGHDITVAVLDNATTAMTGSQPHPGTGVTLMGERRKPVDIEGMLRAMGVECIVSADPLNLEQATSAAAQAIAFEGPSALMFRSPCIQLKKPSAAVCVDASACTGCKRCITEIGCPAIGFDAEASGPKSASRGQAFVDASLCNGCGLCTQVCPFDALAPSVAEVSEGGLPAVFAEALSEAAPDAELRDPVLSDASSTPAESGSADASSALVAPGSAGSADAASVASSPTGSALVDASAFTPAKEEN